MVKIYVRRIKAGRMKLEEVPALWREQVAAMLQGEKE